jgi:two-component system, OmpR family, sensor kinase
MVEDMGRSGAPGRIVLTLPDQPVMSDLDPDAFGILFHNLVDNALQHGSDASPVDVTLTADGTLTVANEGAVLSPETLQSLTARFERAGASTAGSGLGLAIVAAIADRIGSSLILESPRPGACSGFQASLRLPTDVPDTFARDAMRRK